MEKKVYLIDGTSLAYRAYYAIKGLSTSKGFPTNAVFGFVRIFLKLLKELQPEYALVAFDAGKTTFRKELHKEYKANRRATPDDFKSQLPFIKRFLECLGVKTLELPGYEADDIIGTLAKKLKEKGFKVVIVTPDKDMKQLLSEGVEILIPPKKSEKPKKLRAETFEKETGLKPEQIPDLFGLAGDKTDNIPGVPGVGEKTAAKLLKQFGNLEGIYRNLNELPPKLREKLKEHEREAFLSRELAKIETEAPVDVEPEELKLKEPRGECLGELLKELEMKSVEKELKKLYPNLTFGPALPPGKEVKPEEFEKELKGDLFSRPKIALFAKEGQLYLGSEGKFCRVSPEEGLKLLKRCGTVVLFNQKELYHLLGEELQKLPTFDASLALYLLNPLLKDYSPETVGSYLLKGEVKLPQHLHHLTEVEKPLKEGLKERGLTRLYEEVELPLSLVLYRMEKRGVPFDRKALEELQKELEAKAEELQARIHELAGEAFNINSPKQLSQVLFEKLGLKPLKKTKSGYSTDVETLTTLALEGHEIARLLLEYRKTTKLLSTFVRGILERIDRNGRVHSRFVQTGTATGRLSSVNPNLQNLPVSDPVSVRVRNAVKAPEGKVLVWADYSQVELRILAHFSEDPNLIEAFREGKDVHLETAKRLFPGREITPQLRRVAKTVNFGLIYGMSPHGLAERLNIPLKEAEEYVELYFKNFPKVKEFIEETVKRAYREGEVRTLLGRVRPLPELRERNYHLRSFGERAAVNAVIQGTAADVMKLSMVKMEERLSKLNAALLLQVHDEVVVETPKEAAEEVAQTVKETMEKAVELLVPLEVEVKVGERWS